MHKFTKKDVGKEIFLVPTGNNARYKREGFTSKILKIGRVNVTVTDRWDREMMLRFDDCSNYLSEGHNSGYKWYWDEDDYNKEIYTREVSDNFKDSVFGKHSWSSGTCFEISLEQWAEIYKILNLELP